MYAFPRLGAKPVGAIVIADVLEVLEPIWTAKAETASRIRGRIEAVIGYATARHWRTGPNPAAWTGNLKHLLPPRSEIARVEHFSALPWRSVPAMMAAGEGYTVHGTARSSFRDWAVDQTAFPREIAEAALAHINADKVEAAYLTLYSPHLCVSIQP